MHEIRLKCARALVYMCEKRERERERICARADIFQLERVILWSKTDGAGERDCMGLWKKTNVEERS